MFIIISFYECVPPFCSISPTSRKISLIPFLRISTVKNSYALIAYCRTSSQRQNKIQAIRTVSAADDQGGNWVRRSGRFRRLLGTAAAIAVLAGSLAAFPALSTALGSFLGKAAAASAMLQLPEGGMAYLQNRFQDDLVQDEPISASQPQAEKPIQSAISAQSQAYRLKARRNLKVKVRLSSHKPPNLHPSRPLRLKTVGRSPKRLLRLVKALCIFRFLQGILKIQPACLISRFYLYWPSPWNLRWKIPTSLRY